MHSEAASRRRRAAALFARGLSRAEAARRLGVSRSTAAAWHRAWSRGGASALETKRTGRAPRVSAAALAARADELARGPRAAGLPGTRWTLKTLALWLERRTGARHHPGHMWKVLRRAGWSLPALRAATGRRLAFLVDPDGNRLVVAG